MTTAKHINNKETFRRSRQWQTFRENIRQKQQIDPVTGAKLTKSFNVHHLDLNSAHYNDISDETHFVGLNSTTHTVIHYLFGDTRHRNNWRYRLLQLEKLCCIMEELNK